MTCNIYSDDAQSTPALRQHRISLTLTTYGPDGTGAWPPSITEIVNFSIRLFIRVNFDYAERSVTLPADLSVGAFRAYAQATVVVGGSGYVDSSLVGYTDPQSLGATALNDYIWPQIARATFNTLSFSSRKAKIGDTNLQYFMILDPRALCPGGDLPCANRLVFTLPEQFGYPPVSSLDSCAIESNTKLSGVACYLLRVDNDKYVTFYPYIIDPTQYRHQIAMITLANGGEGFSAPAYPGTQYTITVAAYSDDTLVEKATVHLSNVLGYGLDLTPDFNVLTGLDSDEMTLTEVSFVVGDLADVPPGYDSESFSLYSSIVLTFDTSVSGTFANDLGTGAANLTELGCKGVSGVRTTFIGRLTCYLRTGSNALDPPQVLIGGYDAIPAGTKVVIFVTYLRALRTAISATVAVGVRLTYKDFDNVTAYYYGPLSIAPPVTSPAARSLLPAGAYAERVEYTGSNQVLQTGTYNFTFQLARKVPAGDYFRAQFQKDYFERYSDYSGVRCQHAVLARATLQPLRECAAVHVFGVTNAVYMQASSDLPAGAVVSFVLSGLVSPAYSAANTQSGAVVKGATILSRKIDAEYVFRL
jgi:hypothetical protein